MRHEVLRFGLALLATAVPLAASAHEGIGDPFTLRRLVQESDLIFQGVVRSIEYRNAEILSPGDQAIPHTFVTFEIERLFKGRPESQGSITLRLQGGPDGNGQYLMISAVPTFDIGDRDILFVSDHYPDVCPILGWAEGRLRILDGAGYSEYGRELWLSRENHVLAGDFRPAPEVLTHQIGDLEFTAEPGPADAVVGFEPPAGARRADLTTLTTTLDSMVRAIHTPAQLAALEPLRSARLTDRLVVGQARPLAPPLATPIESDLLNDDFYERNQLEKSQGDPTLVAPTAIPIVVKPSAK